MARTAKSKPNSVKKVVKSKAKVQAAVVEKAAPVANKVQIKFDRSKVMKALLYTLLFVLSFALIDLFVQYLNNGHSVAVVNGQRVSKSVFYDRLSKAYGAQATTALIDEVLIEQEGASKGITVSQDDIDDRMKEIEEQLGGEKVLQETLDANNISRKDIERQVRLEILTKKVLEPTIKYEDKDVEAFFEQYKGVLYQEEDVKFEDKKDEVTKSFLAQKVEEAKTTWLEELRAKAKVQNNITTKPTYGVFKTVTNIVNNIFDEAKNK